MFGKKDFVKFHTFDKESEVYFNPKDIAHFGPSEVFSDRRISITTTSGQFGYVAESLAVVEQTLRTAGYKF